MNDDEQKTAAELEKVQKKQQALLQMGAGSGDEEYSAKKKKSKGKKEKDEKKKRNQRKKKRDSDSEDEDEDDNPASDAEEQKPASSSSAAPAAKPWEHDKQPPITGPVVPVYDPVTGYPPDYAEWHPKWGEAKAGVLSHWPQYYTHLPTEELAALSLGDKAAASSGTGAKVEGEAGEKKEGGEDEKKKKKEKKEEPSKVTIQKVARRGKKCVTVVTGLEKFGVKLEKASKVFSKGCACGASVVKGQPGLPDAIEVQGDAEDTIIDLIKKEFAEVPENSLVFLKAK